MQRLLAFLAALSLAACLASARAETCVFGHYEQDNDLTNGPEPITWLVVDQEDGRRLLVAEQVLSCRRYHAKYNNKTHYETSEIRQWLNETFLQDAFTPEEAGRIALTENANPSKRGYKSKGGADTEDYVFLLSYQELETYFPEKEDRVARPTAYARSLGLRVKRDACPWWLRTPGREQHHASCVTIDGGYYDYFDITCPTNGIRPALWLLDEE